MAVGAIGLGIQLASAYVGDEVAVIGYDNPTTLNLFIYLLGNSSAVSAYVCLNTAVNPMLNLLGGGGNKGNQLADRRHTQPHSRVHSPLLVGMLVGTTYQERPTMLSVAPLVLTGYRYRSARVHHYPVSKDSGTLEQPPKGLNTRFSAPAFRHCLLGVIAIFSVGIEIGISGELNAWTAPREL